MKANVKKVFSVFLATVFALSTILGVGASSFAAGETVTYVSLGASNVNGYGMRGYLDDSVYDQPWLKSISNIYGFERQVEGSYPDLLADAIAEAGYTVERRELAMSSMRAEELRFLLDDTYKGDAYLDWRFCDVEGYEGRSSQNWFVGAGRMVLADDTASAEEAVAALRAEYKEAVAEADIITVDIGINNFGVYVSNQLMGGMFENDLNLIDPEIAAQYQEAKATVAELAEGLLGEAIDGETFDFLLDTMAYALVGFCVNFDVVMEKIYELNPDATVVVVSIQNLMDGLYVDVGDGEPLPLGDLFGALVNVANIYAASVSPHSSDYYYADVRAHGHVEFYMDEIAAYDGDPSTLSQNMKDCFNAYDDNLLTKLRIQMLLSQFFEAMYGDDMQIEAAQMQNFDKFVSGIISDSILINGIPYPEYLDQCAAGEIEPPQSAAYVHSLYETTLEVAYDVVAEIMQAGIKETVIDLSALNEDFGSVEDALIEGIFDEVMDAFLEILDDLNYEYTLPEDFFAQVAEECNAPESLVKTVAIMGIRTGIGNSFFGHPNGKGHKEVYDAVVSAINDRIMGKDIVREELSEFIRDLLHKHTDPEKVESIVESVYEFFGTVSEIAYDVLLTVEDIVISVLDKFRVDGEEEAEELPCGYYVDGSLEGSGEYVLFFDNYYVGAFILTEVDGGWTIMDYADGTYLTYFENNLVYSDEPFVWSYEDGIFFHETGEKHVRNNFWAMLFGKNVISSVAYLVADANEKMDVSSVEPKIGFTFMKWVADQHHFIDGECRHCGATAETPHVGEGEHIAPSVIDSDGEYYFLFDGDFMGKFEFVNAGDGYATLKGEDGYIAAIDGEIGYTEEPFYWLYDEEAQTFSVIVETVTYRAGNFWMGLFGEGEKVVTVEEFCLSSYYGRFILSEEPVSAEVYAVIG